MRWTVRAFGLSLVLAIPACGDGSKSSVAVQVAVGQGHACAAFADGSARCWGAWREGQRGDGVTLNGWPEDWLSRDLRPNPETRAVPNLVINLTDAVELAAGALHTCARRKDGTVWCWGTAGQSGTETEESAMHPIPYPVAVVGITDAVQLAAADVFTCARRSDGSVWCWGDLGEGLTNYEGKGFPPRPIPGVRDTVEIRAGGQVACALLSSGSVMCWGANTEGQLGDGSAESAYAIAQPTVVPHRDAAELSLGKEHICTGSSTGKVSCWGSNDNKRATVPEGLALKIVVAGGANTCGLAADGAFWCWGGSSLIRSLLPAKELPASNEEKMRIGTVSNAKQLVLEDHHACVRLDSGAVQCWGYSWRDTETKQDEQATGPFVVSGLGKALDIAAGSVRTCAVVEGGTVQCWNNVKKLDTLKGVSDATQVCLGVEHGCALRTNGTVTCWGMGNHGQLGRGLTEDYKKQPAATVPGLGAVEQVAASNRATCARLKGGIVRCWGDNENGELGQGFFSSEGPKSASGQPLTVRLPSPAVDLRGGGNNFCAKLSDGAIACWGSNRYGLVVDTKSQPNRKPPTPVSTVKDAAQIAVANLHACARTKGGKVLCWGSNEHGQMGDGTWGRGNIRATPVEIPSLAGATEVVVSYRATCGRMAGGRVACVGGGGGMLWELPGLQAASQIALSPRVESWLVGESGQPARPSGCAVMNNGALACWGESAPGSAFLKKMGPPAQVRW